MRLGLCPRERGPKLNQEGHCCFFFEDVLTGREAGNNFCVPSEELIRVKFEKCEVETN